MGRADAPVFVHDGYETSSVNRLPFLDMGIMEILARATGGIGIVLDHRCVLEVLRFVRVMKVLRLRQRSAASQVLRCVLRLDGSGKSG